MKYLLDTHILLWGFDNEEKLSEMAVRIIRDPGHTKYASIASSWELAIKISKGSLVFDGGVNRFLELIDESGLVLLPIKRKHVKMIEILPHLHGDPFDRILIASAISEGMRLITADENIHKYDVPWIW